MVLKPVVLGEVCPGLGRQGASWREKALGTAERPGCSVLAIGSTVGTCRVGRAREGGLCPYSPCPPPGQALHLRKVPGRVRGAKPHQDTVGAGDRAAEGAPAPRHGCPTGEGGDAQQRGRVEVCQGRASPAGRPAWRCALGAVPPAQGTSFSWPLLPFLPVGTDALLNAVPQPQLISPALRADSARLICRGLGGKCSACPPQAWQEGTRH